MRNLFIISLLLMLAGPAGAASIVSSSATVQSISAPALLDGGILESDQFVRIFAEQQNVLLRSIPSLAGALQGPLINATQPGTYDEIADFDSGELSLDLVVSSFRLFFDQVGGNLNNSQGVSISGSITFDEQIVGVAASMATPVGSILTWSALMGSPATTYQVSMFGGLDLLGGSSIGIDGPDQFTISTDRRTLTFSLTNGSPFIDSMQILTSVPEPTLIGLIAFSGIAAIVWRRASI